MIIRRFILTTLLFSLSFAMITPVLAESNQKKQGELKRKIASASGNLKVAKDASNKLKKNVQFYEGKLNVLSRELHGTERKVKRLSKKLTKLNDDKTRMLEQVTAQKSAIAQQMQALYTIGKDSHLRLMLKQDNPSEINRSVKYFEYLNKHRLKRIQLTQKKLKRIKALEVEINKDTQVLSVLQEEQSVQKNALKATVKEKNKAYKKQNKLVYSQEKILAKLIKKEAALKNVIKRLSQKEKREREAREKAKRNAVVKSKNPKKTTVKTVISTKHPYVPNKAFSSLRGKLAWPVRGTITNKFGGVKNSKQKWRGITISAPRGRKVHAVARGKVEFSGRLDGYGHLIIIRHDKNYRSLYAYNQGLFKNEGDIVKGGEVIASVGSSGGQSKTGLYFEIRKGTSHQNPARWCKK